MAYNSDGYIMIDFSMVDFRKTNQTIDGLFERCKNVIGTNKFVIVINANNKTPLPSTVSITNGQYVIESVLYTFSISSADNLHITKKTTPEELIDDDHVTLKTTFSSNKIMSIIEGAGIKSFSYTGKGGNQNTITFPDKPKYILSIERDHTTDTSNDPEYKLLGAAWNFTYFGVVSYKYVNQNNIVMGFCKLTYDDDNNQMTFTSSDGTSGLALNVNNIDYTVYYI